MRVNRKVLEELIRREVRNVIKEGNVNEFQDSDPQRQAMFQQQVLEMLNTILQKLGAGGIGR